MKKPSILFIGAGRMAEAMIAGLRKKSLDQIGKVFVANRSDVKRLQQLEEKYGVIKAPQWKDSIKDVDMIVLAMPPGEHETLLDHLNQHITNQFIVTIAAGISPSFLEKRLPSNIGVGWIMPNTASTIGHSISLYTYGKNVTETNKQQMKILLNSIGKSHLCSEEDIYKLTAVTGSSPAFVYLFVESLIDITKELGVTENVSKKLVMEMIAGSVEMLKTGITAKELREQVTTPGGATAEGIKLLTNGGFQELIQEAIKATNNKARGTN